MKQKNNQKGFTLVELSIVIIIIGLIVAGVVGGQELIYQAKLRSIISDYNKYHTAVVSFRSQYDGLPGDLPQATASAYSWVNNADTSLRSNNFIDDGAATNGYASEVAGDIALFWSHLGDQGSQLIKGNYAAATSATIATTMPLIGNAAYWGVMTVNKNWETPGTEEVASNAFLIGIAVGTNPNFTPSAYFSTIDAKGIDDKIDDGIAGTGIVMAQGVSAYTAFANTVPSYNQTAGNAACTTGSTATLAAENAHEIIYNVAYTTTKVCAISVKMSL